jgi:small subunit ribosomal protein S6
LSIGGISLDTVVKRLYEGLFLVDSGQAAADWDGIISAIEKALARADAEVVSINKWDERKLAYDIGSKARGTYILVYFNGDPSRIAAIERDVNLSEQIIRVMILRTEKMSKEDIGKETPVAIAERRVAEAEAESQERQAKAEAAKAAKDADGPAEVTETSGDIADAEQEQE